MSSELEQLLATGLVDKGGDDGAADAAAAAADERSADEKMRADQEDAYDRIFSEGRDDASNAKAAADQAEGGAQNVGDEILDDEGLTKDAAEAAAGNDGEAERSANEDGNAPVTAPEHWSQADKERFAKLPDESRQWWLDKSKELERGYQDKFQEIAAVRKENSEIGAALQPVDALIQQHGITRADAVARLVGADQLLRQDFGQGISTIVAGYGRQIAGTDQARHIVRQVAQQLGVDLGGAKPDGQGDQAKPIDPRVDALERRFQTWEQQQQAQREQQAAQSMQSAQAQLDTFREAKDDAGGEKHPHYEAVKAVMGALLTTAFQSGQAMTLEDAYEQAVWSRPELREALTKAQQEAAAKAAAERRRSEVAKAKAAGTPQTKSAPPGRENSLAGKSLREAQEAEYDRIFGADGA